MGVLSAMQLPLHTVELRVARPERLCLLERLPEFQRSGRLCDVQLKSREGDSFAAHRLVLSLASDALAALLGGGFMEAQSQKDVEVDLSSRVLEAVLGCIYTGSTRMPLVFIGELLRFAHMYGLESLLAHAVETVVEHMDPNLCAELLPESGLLGIWPLEAACRKYALKNFEACVETEAFTRWPGALLLSLLQSDGLQVSSEERVLRGVWMWWGGSPERTKEAALLLTGVRFPLLSANTRAGLDARAQGMGSMGTELQRLLNNGGMGVSPQSLLRNCFPCCWAEFGCSIQGGVVVAGGNGAGYSLSQLSSPFSCAVIDEPSKSILVADRLNHRIVRWPLDVGANRPLPQVVAGQGAPTARAVTLGSFCKICVDTRGRLVVSSEDPDERILRFQGDSAEELRVEMLCPSVCDVKCGPDGALYILDEDGTRVLRRAEDESGQVVVTVVAGGNGEGSEPNQLNGAENIIVAQDGAVYVADRDNHRVQRWDPGAKEGVTVAGGSGVGSALRQLNHPRGMVVTSDGSVYIADSLNHRIVKWSAGQTAGVVVAGGNGQGALPHQLSQPIDLARDSEGALYVVEANNNRVTKWGPSPKTETVFD